MKFTKIPANTFEQIQLNAGVLLSAFDPEKGEFDVEDILGATTGGAKFSDKPSYIDYGDDVDNCPKNTKELKRIDNREIKMEGTYVTVTGLLVQNLVGAAEISGDKITPRDTLTDDDFTDMWWVGDYSNKDGGYIAIHMMNSLSTGGLQIQSGDKTKGNFPFEYTAHYSISDQETVPYEIYVHNVAK